MIAHIEGAHDGPVKHIMRHFTFAAHRFESQTDPRRRCVCKSNAIASVLADVAGDTRRSQDERDRAEAGLQYLTPQHILEDGLSADYAEIGTRSLCDASNVYSYDKHDMSCRKLSRCIVQTCYYRVHVSA